jgi:uncharacterized lipoprotein YddW (UPF0748 family)
MPRRPAFFRQRRWLCAVLLALHMAADAAGAQPALRIELVVRTVNNFKDRDDVAVFFERARKARVTVVHVAAKQDEDDERPSGQVFYASAIAPIAAGYEKFDALAAAIAEAHKRGIKVYAWLPQFHDQAALHAHPEWQMMASEHGRSRAYAGKDAVEYFVNPIDPEVQAYELSLIKEVARNYQVDGISLDWLRFDDINMDTGPVTRRLAAMEIGLDPLQLNFAEPSASVRRWQAWRTQKLSAYVARIRQAVRDIRPEIRLTAFVLPPQFTEVGQDLSLFSGDLDEVHPMAYFKDWSYSPAWTATRLMTDVEQKRTRNTAVKPTLDGSGTFAQNVGILTAVHGKFPEVDAVAWFAAGYWQPAEIDRIVRIHKAAAAENTKAPGSKASR